MRNSVFVSIEWLWKGSLDLNNVLEIREDFCQRGKAKIDFKSMSQTPTKEVRESKGVIFILIFKLKLYLEICETPWKYRGILSLWKW